MKEIEIKKVGEEAEHIVQKIFEATPDYFLKVEGSVVEKHFARKEMQDFPKKMISSYEKIYCLVLYKGEPIGVLDLHKNHPQEKIGYIGLLLLDENHQRRGLGKKIYAEIEKFILKLGIKEIRIAIHEKNDVTPFWEKMGFAPNGHSRIWQGEKTSGKITEFAKSLFKLN